MTLGNATTPERVVAAFGQDAARVQAREREHARIPPRRDDGHLAAFPRSCVHLREMGGDVRVRVERIDHGKQLGACGRLLRQVVRAAAAEDEHVHIVGMRGQVVGSIHRHGVRERMHACRIAPREQRHQL